MNTYRVLVNGVEEPFIITADTESEAIDQVKVLVGRDDISGDIELL